MGRTSLKGSYYIGLTSNLSPGKWRACDRFFSPQAAPKPPRLQTGERLPQGVITYSRCRSACLSAMTFSSRAVQLLQNQSFQFQGETLLPRRPVTPEREEWLAPTKRQLPRSQKCTGGPSSARAPSGALECYTPLFHSWSLTDIVFQQRWFLMIILYLTMRI